VGSLSVKEIFSERDFRDFAAARRIIIEAVSSFSLILLSPLSVDIELCLEGEGTLTDFITLIASASWSRPCA
jgi:hypothetical protein